MAYEPPPGITRHDKIGFALLLMLIAYLIWG